ncbi:vacuolar protein sorting complex subunit [Angomonas deanei]|nr:vacuolar protein sorting complex subunit [Angomonas deanei]|eukprot:EPY37350.1 vacuolar protein sorting complex subunit [Angomonas deanei]
MVLNLVNIDDPSYNDTVDDIPIDTVLFQECDGVKLISTSAYQFLQVIPDGGRRVFSVASQFPGAMLVSAYDEFMSGNATAVRMLHTLQQNSDQLTEAINDCIVSAGMELNVPQQKRLLRIAAFGKSFSTVYDSSFFTSTVKSLRVINTLHSLTGMSLTLQQLKTLGNDALIKRLLGAGQYQVAFSVTETLSINGDLVLSRWALTKLLSCPSEERVPTAHAVIQKLRSCNCSCFAQIAIETNLKGRHSAAVLFALEEKNASLRVSTLLSINEPEEALKTACQSCDADTIFTCVNFLLNSRGAKAIPILLATPNARQLLMQFIRATDGEVPSAKEFLQNHPKIETELSVRRYLYEEGRLRSAIRDTRRELSWEVLQECKASALHTAVITNRRDTNSSLSEHLSTHERLIELQTQLMKDYGDVRFLNASVFDVVRYALEHGKISVAKRVKGDFKLPEKQYQWCALLAFSSTGQWESIDELGEMGAAQPSNRLLLPPEAFVSTLLQYKRPQQARQYVPRVSTQRGRIELFVQCGDWSSAALECRRASDANALLQQLKGRARGNKEILEEIESGWSRGEGKSNDGGAFSLLRRSA